MFSSVLNVNVTKRSFFYLVENGPTSAGVQDDGRTCVCVCVHITTAFACLDFSNSREKMRVGNILEVLCCQRLFRLFGLDN